MVFASICALLLGRLLIRGAYYIWLLSRFGDGNSHALKSRLRGVVNAVSSIVWSVQSTQERQVKSASNGVKVKGPFPVLIAFQRPFRRVFKSAVFLSAVLCFLYSHCWSRTLRAFDVTREEGGIVCRGVFLPMLLFGSSVVHTTGSSNCHSNHSCADERSVWILWAAAILGHLWAYTTHEFTGKHHKDYRIRSYFSSHKTKHDASAYELDVTKSVNIFDTDSPIHGVDSNDNMQVECEEQEEAHHTVKQQNRGSISGSISATIQKFTAMKPVQPKDTLSMVSWYSHTVLSTGFDLLVSFKIFLGRFDARKMQVALLSEKRGLSGKTEGKEGVFDFSNCKHPSNSKGSDEVGFWFDWVSDCGDGFNSSYQVARVLAQPSLNVATASSSSSRHCGRRTLPRGKLLINGGDLAYPDPTPDSYENRFFRTFEDALPPPPSFRREHISIRKPALPAKGWNVGEDNNRIDENSESDLLSSYQGPCAFLIPGNHDWFDGLATYTRYILSRDWLGGWLMPQRTSYFGTMTTRASIIFYALASLTVVDASPCFIPSTETTTRLVAARIRPCSRR